MLEVGKQIARLAVSGTVAAWLAILSLQGALAQETIEPDAQSVLQAMSDYLGGLQAFSADYEVDFDIIAKSGQKFKFVSSGDLIVQRPGQLRITRKGTIADLEFVLDGEFMTIYGRRVNGYIQLPASTIDEAIDRVRDDIGFDAPGADLISEVPLDTDVIDIESGIHVGMTDIGGVSVHHLAFRGDRVDWQLWVQDGEEPLPVKYVITSKWVTGAPEFSLQFSNWDVTPSIGPAVFTFTPPAGAKKYSSFSIDDTGQIINAVE